MSKYAPGVYAAWATTVAGLNEYGSEEWPASGAFDKIPGIAGNQTGWGVNASSPHFTRQLSLRLPVPILLDSLVVERRIDIMAPTSQLPSLSMLIYGSNDGNSWDYLDAVFSPIFDKQFFRVKRPGKLYSFFRVTVLESLFIGELRYFGSLAYDPLVNSTGNISKTSKIIPNCL